MIRRVLETTAVIIGTLGWWGFVYPELCLLETSYEEEIQEDEEEPEDQQTKRVSFKNKEKEDFKVIITLPESDCGAEKEVHIKSKIAEYVYQIRSREAEKDNQNDS